MSDKKKVKFKDTGFGKLLLKKIPSAVGIVGDLLPDQGVLGIAKNLISNAETKGEITPEVAEQLRLEADRELKFYEIDQRDRASARQRQVELVKAGAKDWMMSVSGLFALLAAIAIVYVVLFLELKSDKELFYFVAGAAFTWAGQVITFYFGSSKGSKDKTSRLNQILK